MTDSLGDQERQGDSPEPRSTTIWPGFGLAFVWFLLVGWAAIGLTSETISRMRLWPSLSWKALKAFALAIGLEPDRLVSLGFVLLLALLLLVLPHVARSIRDSLALPALAVASSILLVALAAGARALPDLLWLLALAGAVFELGRRILSALGALPDDPLERTALSTAFGSGALGLFGLLLGALGLLRRPVLLGALALLWLFLIMGWRKARAPREGQTVVPAKTLGPLEITLLGITSWSLLTGYTMALAPEVQSDAVRVHLAMARVFASTGSMPSIPTPHIPIGSWPLHVQILFTVGYSLHGPILAKLLHTAAGAAAVLCVGLVARRITSRFGGLVAAALLASLPVGILELGTAYVDLFATWYVAVAALCFLKWDESGEARWALLTGAALGLGLASKLTVGFNAIAFGLAFLLRRRPATPARELLRPLRFAGLGGLVTLGPWLVRSMILSRRVPGLSLLADALGSREGKVPASLLNLPGFGVGRNPLRIVLMPWDLTFNSSKFGENPPGFVGIAFLLLFPALLLLLTGRPRRRVHLALALLVLVPFLFWFFTAQYLRYLLPTLGLFCALLACGFEQLRERLTGGGAVRWAQVILAAALVGALSLSVLYYLAKVFVYPGELPVGLVLGRETPEAYLTRKVPQYAVLQRLDQEVGPGEPVAILPEGFQMYTHATLLGPFNGGGWLLSSRTVPELLENFEKRGISRLVLDRNAISASWLGAPVFETDFLQNYMETSLVSRNVGLFRLRAGGPSRVAPAEELLQNGGFESVEGSRPAFWKGFGTPRYSVLGGDAHTGRAAVFATTSDGYNQLVSVHPGHHYWLRHFSRCERPGSSIRLQINWLDEKGAMLPPTIQVSPAKAEYTGAKMLTEAPAHAAYANVYVSTHENAPCWFDDFSFKEAR